jgi:hypothetical protein
LLSLHVQFTAKTGDTTRDVGLFVRSANCQQTLRRQPSEVVKWPDRNSPQPFESETVKWSING